MSIRHTLSYSVQSDSGVTSIGGTQSEVGNAEIPIVQAFAAGSAGAAVAGVSFAQANLQSIVLVADKNCSITFAGPGVTIALVAGSPFVWERSTGYYPNPFAAADVTGATLSCTPAVNLKGRILVS